MRQEIEARQSLDGLLEYLSQRRWLQIIQGSKTGLGGYETLDYSRLKFSPKGCVVSDDEKVSVIRFGKNDSFGLIGQWKEPVFYVFGYDFDYSAYNHGS